MLYIIHTEVFPMAVLGLKAECIANVAPSCQPIIFFYYFWSDPMEKSTLTFMDQVQKQNFQALQSISSPLVRLVSKRNAEMWGNIFNAAFKRKCSSYLFVSSVKRLGKLFKACLQYILLSFSANVKQASYVSQPLTHVDLCYFNGSGSSELKTCSNKVRGIVVGRRRTCLHSKAMTHWYPTEQPRDHASNSNDGDNNNSNNNKNCCIVWQPWLRSRSYFISHPKKQWNAFPDDFIV